MNFYHGAPDHTGFKRRVERATRVRSLGVSALVFTVLAVAIMVSGAALRLDDNDHAATHRVAAWDARLVMPGLRTGS